MKLVFPRPTGAQPRFPDQAQVDVSALLYRLILLVCSRAPYRRASFYPLVHFFKSKPSTCTCFLPSPPLSALPRSVSNLVMTEVQKITFCQNLKIWDVLSHR